MALERVWELATRDALKFYDELMDRFHDKRDKPNEFIIAFYDYKEQRDLGIFVEKMKEILEGEIDLILKFNTFIPKQYQIKYEECLPRKRPEPEDATKNLREIKKMKDSSDETTQISFDQAMKYLTEIQDAFKDDIGKFNEFLRSMRDYRTKRIDMMSLKSRVKELFKGHKHLLVKFNAFLPDEGEVEDEDEVSSRQKPVVNVEYAMKYVLNVKTKFQHNPQIFKSFRDIMAMYRNRDKSAEEVMQMVISLFEGHQDLVDGFMDFCD